VVSEGAYILLQSLQGDAWDACDETSFEGLDTREAFDDIFDNEDLLYRYRHEVGLHRRCDAFGEFSRQPKETLKAYVLRNGKELTKLLEAGLDLPDLLVVTESLKTMFGGDSVTHKKDIDRVLHTYKAKHKEGESDWVEDTWEDAEDAWYEDDEDPHEHFQEGEDEWYDDVGWEDEVPEELETAYELAARSKKSELAKSRGFYPV
ncbi:unnamed protein product, partial [Prorocentrum cordatum]